MPLQGDSEGGSRGDTLRRPAEFPFSTTAFSQNTPAMMKRRPNIIAAIVVIALSVTLMWYGWAGWGLLVVYLGYLGVALFATYRAKNDSLARLKAARIGETFESFFERLNRPDYDRKLVWQVYTAIRSMAGLDAEDVALRPYDDLVRDLRIDPDDLDEALFSGLKGPLGLVDSVEALNANPHRHRRQTVGGLVDFFANHPKWDGQALSSMPSAAPSSTPSARST
jgi:hypothetical protein